MAPRSNSRGGNSKKKDKLSKTLIVGPFRMAFPALFEPEEDDHGNEKFKVTMLFPPDCPSIDEIHDAFEDVMIDYFGPEDEWPSGKKDILPEDKFYDAGKKDYQGFKKGWMVLTASSMDQPGIIDADKNEVMSKREVYGGRWGRAQITITTFDNKAKGATAYLNHVQLLENDEAFSGRGSAEDAFDKYELKDKGRGRSRDGDDEDDNRGSRRGGRGRDRDADDADERGNSRRGSSRRSRDDEDDADDRGRGGSRRGRDREDEDDGKEDRGRGRGGRSANAREDEREDDDRPRGRGRGRDRDEDEEERPSRSGGRSRSREDDEDDRPSRRGSRSSSRDADDDDRPSRGSRRSSRDDDERDDGGWN